MATCVPVLRSRQGLVALGTWAFIAAVLGEELQDAKSRLTHAGAEMSLAGFEHDPSLLTFGFKDQLDLPSPDGSLTKSPKVVSLRPYAVMIDDFLSPRECEFLRSLALTRLKPAMVVQSGDNWYDQQTQTRNNEQVWLTQPEEREVPILKHVMKRIHRTVRVPDEYAEALQIGRYKVEQKYEGHIDSDPPHNVARPTTILMYLNEVEEGGHTIFPAGRTDCGTSWRVHPKTGEKVYGAKVCCDTPEEDTPETIRVIPKIGRAIVFFSHHPNGGIDNSATHIACPIIKGEKWVAQRWLRYEPYNRVRYDDYNNGFDPRFDGMPRDELRTASREDAHTRVISQINPKLFMQEHFVDNAEIAHLKSLLDGRKDELLTNEVIAADEVLAAITARAHLFALLPSSVHTQMKLRRFVQGESDPVHMSVKTPDEPNAVTVSIYLESVEEGGELFFPGRGAGKTSVCNADLEACCNGPSEMKFRPHRGDAVLLYSYDQRGRLDSTSRHGHCPLKKGEFFVAELQFQFQPQVQGAPASQKLNQQPKVLFDNQGTQLVEIFWVDSASDGKETSMGKLDGGNTKSMNSYASHIFNVRDETGKLLDKFTVGATAHQRFIITDHAEL